MSFKRFFTEEGWTSIRNSAKRVQRYNKICIGVAIAATLPFIWFCTFAQLRPLQQLYLPKYVWSQALSKCPFRINSRYVLLVRTVNDPSGKESILGVTDDQAEPTKDENSRPVIIGEKKKSYQFRLKPGIEYTSFRWQEVPIQNSEMAAWFARNIYPDTDFMLLLLEDVAFGVAIFLLGNTVAIWFDRRANRERTDGKKIRGTDDATKKLNLFSRHDGIGIEIVPLERKVGC